MDRLLAERAGEDRVLETIPAQPFRSRCVVRASDPGSLARLPTSFEPPPLSLREYHDVLCRRNQVATKGNLVLPESYRHTEGTPAAEPGPGGLGSRLRPRARPGVPDCDTSPRHATSTSTTRPRTTSGTS